MQERRKNARPRVLKSAKIVFGESSVINCGAQFHQWRRPLEVLNTISLPKTLGVTFDDCHSFRKCRLALNASALHYGTVPCFLFAGEKRARLPGTKIHVPAFGDR